MRLFIVAIAALLIMGSAPVRADMGPIVTGKDLIRSCNVLLDAEQGIKAKGFDEASKLIMQSAKCVGFWSAASSSGVYLKSTIENAKTVLGQDLSGFFKDAIYCPAKPLTSRDFANTINAYLLNNIGRLEDNALIVAQDALRQTYPCP